MSLTPAHSLRRIWKARQILYSGLRRARGIIHRSLASFPTSATVGRRPYLGRLASPLNTALALVAKEHRKTSLFTPWRRRFGLKPANDKACLTARSFQLGPSPKRWLFA